MRIPKRIKIFGSKIKIIEIANLVDDNNKKIDGDYCYNTKEIRIEKNNDQKDKMETFLHELGHALFHRVSLSYTSIDANVEELIVNNYATMVNELFDLKFKNK